MYQLFSPSKAEGYSHVSLVVAADLLDPDVVLGVHKGLSGGVGLGQRHHAGYVLELTVVLHLHLHIHIHCLVV